MGQEGGCWHRNGSPAQKVSRRRARGGHRGPLYSGKEDVAICAAPRANSPGGGWRWSSRGGDRVSYLGRLFVPMTARKMYCNTRANRAPHRPPRTLDISDVMRRRICSPDRNAGKASRANVGEKKNFGTVDFCLSYLAYPRSLWRRSRAGQSMSTLQAG